VALGDGAPFDYDAYDAAKQPLAMRCPGRRYAHAEVHAAVTTDPAAAIRGRTLRDRRGERLRSARSSSPARRARR